MREYDPRGRVQGAEGEPSWGTGGTPFLSAAISLHMGLFIYIILLIVEVEHTFSA